MTQRKHKTLVIIVAIATILGLIISIGIGLTLSYQESSKTFSIQADVVYAYLKTYSVGENVSGLKSQTLVSYVLVLNVTNPTDEDICIDNIRVILAGFASKVAQSVEWKNETLSIKRVFNEAQPLLVGQDSVLVPFTATGELSNLGMEPLEQREGYFITAASGGSNVGSSLTLKEVTLEAVSENEYVYNPVFTNDYCFSFRNDDLTIEYTR